MPPEIQVGELLRSIDADEPLLVLDVRNGDDFAAWRIAGPNGTDVVHIPYFDFIDDAAGALRRVPRGRPIVAVCATGESSAMVVDLLCAAGIAARNLAGGMAAYGAHLEPVCVTAHGVDRLEIWQLNRRGKGCLSYVVRAGRSAVVVDPAGHIERYEAFVARLGARIVAVLDTHVHADHLSGGPGLAQRSGAPYLVGCGAAGRGWPDPSALLDDGQREPAPGVPPSIEILATPGHTPSSASYLVGGRYLLSGDTLFARDVGRPDLGGHADAWARELYRTLHERLAFLPDETLILPGHFAGSDEIGQNGVVSARLGALRRTAPFAALSEDEFARSITAQREPAPAAYAQLLRANRGQAAVDSEQAAVLELGHNRCAARAVAAQAASRQGAVP